MSPPLIKALGQESPAILALLRNIPPGSEPLILRFLAVLTESTKPTPEIVEAVMKFYKETSQDARFLIPILYGLTKAEIISYLPSLVQQLPSPLLKSVIHRLLQPQSPITPAAIVTQLHLLDASQVPLKKMMEGKFSNEFLKLTNTHQLFLLFC